MTSSEILAFIGCFTGCSSLAITFYKFTTERFRLKIQFATTENWFFKRCENYSSYMTTLHCVVRVNFINKSTHPVTIYDMDAFVSGKRIKVEPYKEDSLKILSAFEDSFMERKRYDVLPMNRQIHFPLRLQAQETYEGFMFFPFFPDTLNDKEKLNFIFHTTKRKVRKTCLVKEHFAQKVDSIDDFLK